MALPRFRSKVGRPARARRRVNRCLAASETPNQERRANEQRPSITPGIIAHGEWQGKPHGTGRNTAGGKRPREARYALVTIGSTL